MAKLYTVIGGSGFVGRYVVQRLAAAGHRVRVAVRHPNQAMFLRPLGAVGQVEPIAANVRSPASIARAVAGADGVVNLVGILYQAGQQSFAAVQADGAGTVAQAAADTGVGALVHVSAIGADAEGPARYARTKAAGEAAVRAAYPAATILRPSIIFGREDGFFNRFAQLAGMLPLIPAICGDTRFQPVYVDDVAGAITVALTQPAAYAGQTYELGGPRAYLFRDLLKYIAAEIRTTKPVVDIPLPLAKLQAAVLGILPKPMLTLDQLAMLERDNVPSGAMPGLDAFGITATPVEAIVPEYLARFRPYGQFNRRAA